VRNKKVKTWWGVYTLTIDDQGFGVLNEEAEAVFTRGQCHALAIAINQLTGWPIKGVGYKSDSPDSPSHCLNYCPDRKGYVDIKGLHKKPTDNFKVVNRNISQETARKYLSGYLEPNVRAAIPFAKTILRDLEAA
jgi:hypothetical protein